MKKKIVAIGGGECGRITKSGYKMPYETKQIDIETIRLTEKETPNFLLSGIHKAANKAKTNISKQCVLYTEIFLAVNAKRF